MRHLLILPPVILLLMGGVWGWASAPTKIASVVVTVCGGVYGVIVASPTQDKLGLYSRETREEFTTILPTLDRDSLTTLNIIPEFGCPLTAELHEYR